MVGPPAVLEQPVDPEKRPGVKRKPERVRVGGVVIRADTGVLRVPTGVDDLGARRDRRRPARRRQRRRRDTSAWDYARGGVLCARDLASLPRGSEYFLHQ